MPLQTLPPPAGGHQVRGINDSGQLVGRGFDDTESGVCRTRALFWENDHPMTAPFNLGSTALRIPSNQQTRAFAINNRAPLQVVGANMTTGRAFLWEQDGVGGWDPAIDLQLEIDAGNGWALIDGHDINDRGCIVGWGLFQPDPGQSATINAFMLYECPLDCGGDNDANVGIVDFLALLGQWGQVGSSCDVVGVPGVGIQEFLALLGTWGPCCRYGSTSPPQSVQDCIDKFGTEDPAVLERCICTAEPEQCP